jgi:hypothetical protein
MGDLLVLCETQDLEVLHPIYLIDLDEPGRFQFVKTPPDIPIREVLVMRE